MVKKFEHELIIIFIFVFFLLALIINFSVTDNQHFSFLAQSFLEGKTYFLKNFFNSEVQTHTGLIDTVKINNKFYWPLSPTPSIFLVPFVFITNWFGIFFLQGYLQFFLSLYIFYLCFLISRKLGYFLKDSLWLAFAYVFA